MLRGLTGSLLRLLGYDSFPLFIFRFVDELWQIIALFEVAAHPYRSKSRTEAAFGRLDNIIQVMALTFLDAQDTTAATYSGDGSRLSPTLALAQTSSAKTYAYPRPLYDQQQHRPVRLTCYLIS